MHSICAFIGRRPEIQKLLDRFNLVIRPIHLKYEDFVIIPENDDTGVFHSIGGKVCPHCGHIKTDEALEVSFCYIVTDYCGGAGDQSSRVWINGVAKNSPQPNPIDSSLKDLGVIRDIEYDEFDTVGLGRYRDMGDLDMGDLLDVETD